MKGQKYPKLAYQFYRLFLAKAVFKSNVTGLIFGDGHLDGIKEKLVIYDYLRNVARRGERLTASAGTRQNKRVTTNISLEFKENSRLMQG